MHQMITKGLFNRLAAVFFIFSAQTFAGSMSDMSQASLQMYEQIKSTIFEQKSDWMLYGGFYGITQGQQQHIYINGVVGNEYIPTSRSDGNVLVGAGFFRPLYTMHNTEVQLGAQIFYLGTSHVQGQILLENQLNNLNYQYGIRYLPLYLDLKANFLTRNDKLGLVFDAGVGPDFINLTNYQETRRLASTVPDNAFAGQSKTSISVTLGAGARLYALPDNGWLEAGYRFFYLGDAQFKSDNPSYVSPLNSGSMFANAFVLSLHL